MVNEMDDDVEHLDLRHMAWEEAVAARDEAALARLKGDYETNCDGAFLRDEALLAAAVSAWKSEAIELPATSMTWADRVWNRLEQESPKRPRALVRPVWLRVWLPLATCACALVAVALWTRPASEAVLVDGGNPSVESVSQPQMGEADEDLRMLLAEATQSCVALMSETGSAVQGSGQIFKETLLETLAPAEAGGNRVIRLPGMSDLFGVQGESGQDSLWQELLGS